MSIKLKATCRRGNKLNTKAIKYYQSIIQKRRGFQWVYNTLREQYQMHPLAIEQACRAIAKILAEELAQGNSVHIPYVGTFTNKIRTTAIPSNTTAQQRTPIRYSVSFEPNELITKSIRRAEKVFKEQGEQAKNDKDK